MSMNLCFEIKDSSGDTHVAFPWQTSTEITYAVLNAETNEERLEILRESISSWEESLIEEKMEQVEVLLSSEHLELRMM